jgi:hypothetical protein
MPHKFKKELKESGTGMITYRRQHILTNKNKHYHPNRVTLTKSESFRMKGD